MNGHDDVVKWNCFFVTGALYGESTGHRWILLTKASGAELRCFLRSAPEQTATQTIKKPVIWDTIALIMTFDCFIDPARNRLTWYVKNHVWRKNFIWNGAISDTGGGEKQIIILGFTLVTSLSCDVSDIAEHNIILFPSTLIDIKVNIEWNLAICRIYYNYNLSATDCIPWRKMWYYLFSASVYSLCGGAYRKFSVKFFNLSTIAISGNSSIGLILVCYFPWRHDIKHYYDAIMGEMASQITSPPILYLSVYSGADQRKHQSSASLAFVRGIHRRPVNFPHKGPVTRKTFPFDDVIMNKIVCPEQHTERIDDSPLAKLWTVSLGTMQLESVKTLSL